MRGSKGTWPAIPAAVALVTVLAACASGGQEADGAVPGYEESLAEALQGIGEGDETDRDDRHDRGQQFMVSCMAEAGFVYYPAPKGKFVWEQLGLTDREFTLQYGRGISTLIDFRQAQAMGDPEPDDSEMLASMTDEELEAYSKARSSCEQAMVVELGILPPNTFGFPVGSPQAEALHDAFQAAGNDPRIADVVARWSECMKQQGFDYSGPTELEQDLRGQVGHLEQAYISGGEQLVAQGASWDELRVEDVLTEDQLAELREVQAFEVSAGAAEVVCLDQGVDVRGVGREVQHEHIQEAMADF